MRRMQPARGAAPPRCRRSLPLPAPRAAALRFCPQVRSVPIRKDDEVSVVRGTYKGREGKVVQVYRKKWVIHIERITREKVNGECRLCRQAGRQALNFTFGPNRPKLLRLAEGQYESQRAALLGHREWAQPPASMALVGLPPVSFCAAFSWAGCSVLR